MNFEWILQMPWPGIWSVLKIIFIILDVFLIGFFIFLMFKTKPYRSQPKLYMPSKKYAPAKTLAITAFQEHWQEIVNKFNSDQPETVKMAVIEADALVDDILKQLGYEGEHMADRLAKLDTNFFPSAEKIWEAHRIRNELTHAPGIELPVEQAKRLLETYQDFFKEVDRPYDL